MKKMTLLEMVQNILSAIDSDEVNSITDTVESLQVAEIIKETFYEQFNNIFIPEFQGLFQLEALNDLTRPNYLRIPSNVSKVEWIRYKDLRSNGDHITLSYLPPDLFFEDQFMYPDGDTNVVSVTDPSGLVYNALTNGPPTHYTLLEDNYIAFNSFDKAYEDTVQAANTFGFGWKINEFQMDDSYIPPIDGSLFPLLLAESKSTAFINLKQISSSKEEQRARRQRIRMQNDQYKTRAAQEAYWNRGPNFARRRR